MRFLKSFLIVALLGSARLSLAQEITVTFQPESYFNILAGTRDILAVKIEPASAAQDVHFMVGKHENGEYVPAVAEDYLSIAELESEGTSGIKYIMVEAHQDRAKYEADFYIMAVQPPYRGKNDRLAMVDVFIQAACPHRGHYRGGDFVAEICGKSHIHENGQTLWLPSDNTKHLYNESHVTVEGGHIRPLRPGDADYQAHNENVCQYCLADEWIWWRALGALRGAYNSPGSRPIQLFDYYLGDALGFSVDAKISAATLWSNETIFTPVLKVIGIPFAYLETKLVALGFSRADIEATYLHLMVGVVRLPAFRPIGTYARAAMAEKIANVEKALAVVKNRIVSEMPGWVPGLEPVLVTPEGMAFGSELSLVAFSEAAGGWGGRFFKGAGKALRAGKDIIVGTNPFGFGAEFWKAARSAVKQGADGGVLKCLVFVPKWIKNNPTSPLVWYPAYLAMSLNTELGPVSDWVLRPLMPNVMSFIMANELREFARTHWPVLGENEVVVQIVSEIPEMEKEMKSLFHELSQKFGKDKVYRFYVEDLNEIGEIAKALKDRGKQIKILYWLSHGMPGGIGVSHLKDSLSPVIISDQNTDCLDPLLDVLREDALWVFMSCNLGTGEIGDSFCRDIQERYIPAGVLIAPTVVVTYFNYKEAVPVAKVLFPIFWDLVSFTSCSCSAAFSPFGYSGFGYEMNPDDPLIKVFKSD